MRKGAAVIAPLLLLLAGCSERSGGDGGTPVGDECELEPALCDPDAYLATHHCIANDVRPRIYAPDTPGPDSVASPWAQGDYWVYDVRSSERSFRSTLVYYDDADIAGGVAQHYLVGAASPEEALDHALFSTNPMLGRIHRTLYSPHESGIHADMFHFPLCDGSRWTTVFYDATFDLQARPQTVAVPGGGQDPAGFLIEGTSGDGSTLRLTYSPQAKWFTTLDLQRADGLMVTMTLVERGGGKAGEYHFLRAQKDTTLDLAVVDRQGVPVDREDGGEGPYDTIGVWIDASRSAGNGRIEVHLRDPDGTSRACVQVAGQGLGTSPCPLGPLKAQVPFEAGSWSVTVEPPLGDLTTRAGGEARIVSIYDRSGTV